MALLMQGSVECLLKRYWWFRWLPPSLWRSAPVWRGRTGTAARRAA